MLRANANTRYSQLPDGFGGYASRFTDPALGFATGYVYLFKYLLATPNQLAASSLIMKVRYRHPLQDNKSLHIQVLDRRSYKSGGIHHYNSDHHSVDQLLQRSSLRRVRILAVIAQGHCHLRCNSASSDHRSRWRSHVITISASVWKENSLTGLQPRPHRLSLLERPGCFRRVQDNRRPRQIRRRLERHGFCVRAPEQSSAVLQADLYA